MKIGILVPLAQELQTLTKSRLAHGTCECLSDHLVVCVTGIGREKTQKGFEKLLDYRVDLMVSWGSAAGLSHEVAAGDLLLPLSVKVNDRYITTDGTFNQKMSSLIPEIIRVHQGAIMETKQVLASDHSKQQLFETSKCLAADMESGTLATLASHHHIPFSVIRAVSDTATTTLPKTLLSSFQNGEFKLKTFMVKAMFSPEEWISIANLMADFKKAQKSLIIAGNLLTKYGAQWT